MNTVRIYMRMLGYLKPYAALFVITFFLSLIIVSVDSMSIWFLGSFTQTIFDPNFVIEAKPEFSFTNINVYLKYWTYQLIQSKTFGNSLVAVCLLIIGSFTVKNLLIYINKLLEMFLNLHIVKDLRTSLYSHVLQLPVSYYDKNKSGSIISHVVNDIAQINHSMTSTLSKLIMEPLRLLFFTSLLFIINLKLTIVIFLVYPGLIFIIYKIGKHVRSRSKNMLEKYSGLVSVLSETISGVRVVKMFNMNEIEADKFEEENNKWISSSFRTMKLGSIMSPLTESLAMYVIAILLWQGGKDVLLGNQAFMAEDFFKFLFYLFLSYQPIKSLATINASLQNGIAAAERVFSLMDQKKEMIQSINTPNIYTFNDEIKFDNVTFSYPECDEIVLNSCTFSVTKGEVFAIVGSSGSGKSTILDLLPRFYSVKDGTITIDGKGIESIELYPLRNLFGIVSQETMLFNDSIKNNICYGIKHVASQELENAIIAANAKEFIDRLESGLETVIGERGVTLSGGQRQRIAIARAILRNPQILILDEATSALDSESEKLVQLAINNLIKNRTVFVVAHRLSTVQHADKIIVLESGKIVEQGTHKSLLELSGRYKQLYDVQFSQD